jgi:hypothetical protein
VRRLATIAIALAGLASLGAEAAAAPAFTPQDGRYVGEYTSGDHGPGKVRLKVEQLREGLHGVRLLKWSGNFHCRGSLTSSVDVPMTAARIGRTFSGVVTYVEPPGKDRFNGRFTDEDALKATVRVTRGEGANRCDTGPIKFVAQRVGG